MSAYCIEQWTSQKTYLACLKMFTRNFIFQDNSLEFFITREFSIKIKQLHWISIRVFAVYIILGHPVTMNAVTQIKYTYPVKLF